MSDANVVQSPVSLDACKLCGGKAEFGEVTDRDHPDFGGHFIACTNARCQCCVGLRYAGGDDPHPLLAEQWNRRAKLEDHGVIEAMLAYPSVNEFVRNKEREIVRLAMRLREALDYVTDATERWPVGSLEHETARAVEARCRAEAEGYPADGTELVKI